MKLIKLLGLALAFGVSLASCDKDEPSKKALDPNTPLVVHVATAKNLRATTANPSARSIEECMTKLDILSFKTPENGGKETNMVVSEEKKDYSKNTIKLYSDFIISAEGKLVNYFIAGSEFVFTGRGDEIVGYIPNSVMRAAQAKIVVAYEAGNYDEVYRLFNEAFTAHPITPEEYQALKEQGKL